MKIGILADDLTGAADSVAIFAQIGLKAYVGFPRRGNPRFIEKPVEALAFSTETRVLPAERTLGIASWVRAAARRFVAQPPEILFKKIDSTLRGHLQVELEAVRKEIPGRLALVCPAFPAQKRTVENGILKVNGVPWQETLFAPPLTGASSVRAAFDAAEDPEAAEIGLEQIREGSEALESRLDRLQAEGKKTVFCDAVTEADLPILARTILRSPERYLPVGSAGLARALGAAIASPAPSPLDLTDWRQAFTQRRVLVVVGSQNPVSRRQAQALREHFKINLFSAFIPEKTLEGAKNLLSAWQRGQRVVLLTTEENQIVPRASAKLGFLLLTLHKLSVREGPRPFDGLIVTGGETAIEVCKALGGVGLHILGEQEPGIVQARLSSFREGGLFDNLPVLLKAGGFGSDDLLVSCLEGETH